MSGDKGGRSGGRSGGRGCFPSWKVIRPCRDTTTASEPSAARAGTGSSSSSQATASMPQPTSATLTGTQRIAQRLPPRAPVPPAFVEPEEDDEELAGGDDPMEEDDDEDGGRGQTVGHLTPQDHPNDRFEITVSDTGYLVPVTPREHLQTHEHIMREISCIFKRSYKKLWLTWGEVEQEDRDDFWLIFSRTFRWDERLDEKVLHIYHQGIGRRWSGILYNVRNKYGRRSDWRKHRPEWIGKDLWPQLVAHWNSEKYLRKCAKARENRAMGPHLTHGRGTKSADTIAQEIAAKNDGVRPDHLTLLEISKSKPPPKGSAPDARGPMLKEWEPIVGDIGERWVEEYGTDRRSYPKKPVAGMWLEPNSKGHVMLGGNLTPDAYGFKAPKKRPGCIYFSQPDPSLHDKLEESDAVTQAGTDTLLQFLGQREEFVGLAEAVKASQKEAKERVRAMQRKRVGSTSRAQDPTDGAETPDGYPTNTSQRPPDDNDDPDQYLNMDHTPNL